MLYSPFHQAIVYLVPSVDKTLDNMDIDISIQVLEIKSILGDSLEYQQCQGK